MAEVLQHIKPTQLLILEPTTTVTSTTQSKDTTEIKHHHKQILLANSTKNTIWGKPERQTLLAHRKLTTYTIIQDKLTLKLINTNLTIQPNVESIKGYDIVHWVYHVNVLSEADEDDILEIAEGCGLDEAVLNELEYIDDCDDGIALHKEEMLNVPRSKGVYVMRESDVMQGVIFYSVVERYCDVLMDEAWYVDLSHGGARRVLFISLLMVDEDCRGKGIGGLLMRFVAKLKEVSVVVLKSVPSAKMFYFQMRLWEYKGSDLMYIDLDGDKGMDPKYLQHIQEHAMFNKVEYLIEHTNLVDDIITKTELDLEKEVFKQMVKDLMMQAVDDEAESRFEAYGISDHEVIKDIMKRINKHIPEEPAKKPFVTIAEKADYNNILQRTMNTQNEQRI